jgi:hypothetical protein
MRIRFKDTTEAKISALAIVEQGEFVPEISGFTTIEIGERPSASIEYLMVDLTDPANPAWYEMDAAEKAQHDSSRVLALKVQKITETKTATYLHIVAHMPEWRQLRWTKYIELFEKVQGGGTLTSTESFIYDGMVEVDKGETPLSVYQVAVNALLWMHQNITVCTMAENAILGINIDNYEPVTEPDGNILSPLDQALRAINESPMPSFIAWNIN